MATAGTAVGPVPDNANEREYCDKLCSIAHLAWPLYCNSYLIPYP